MTFPVRRMVGYAAYFAFIAPPVGGVLTWVLALIPSAMVGSMQNGWSWRAWMSLFHLLPSYIIFSYVVGFFTAAIAGAIYGAFVWEKSPKTEYIASLGVGVVVQGIFLQVFAGNTAEFDPGLTTIILSAGGLSAVVLVAAKNTYLKFRRPQSAKVPNSSL